ncbi:MAG: helix-turn-helix domain-containing protein, partial [Bacteroidetes bacterium]|nr:helix-turn-helix domain-containing protein [Bacteroidota bacterium]
MAGKSLPMNILKQLLLKLQQGQSKKQMARELGISRNTLKHYLA